MKFNFPTILKEEGAVTLMIPDPEAYVGKAWEYSPSKLPVFFNPIMELNRDLAVLVLQEYQETLDRNVSICDPFTGCGIRGLRYAMEVDNVHKVAINDINAEAVKLARFNVLRSGLSNQITIENEDANIFLNQHAKPRKRFDCIDIDPFGSPVPYLDSAVRAIRNGGLIALTATDMAPLCGVYPKTCIRKYGGQPLRTEYCHELAIRLVIGCLTSVAAKHEIGIDVPFSHYADHYVRIYANVHYGARRADDSLLHLGYILHCFSCFHRERSERLVTPLNAKCQNCGSKMKIAGPLWLGKLSNQTFDISMQQILTRKNLKQEKQLSKLLFLVQNEVDAPITYYVVDTICDKLNCPTPPLVKIIMGIKDYGFLAVPTHFNSRGLKTDAPITVIEEVIEEAIA